jgi:hypothetical protein
MYGLGVLGLLGPSPPAKSKSKSYPPCVVSPQENKSTFNATYRSKSKHNYMFRLMNVAINRLHVKRLYLQLQYVFWSLIFQINVHIYFILTIYCDVWDIKIYMNYILWSLRYRNICELYTVQFEISKYVRIIYCEVWEFKIYVIHTLWSLRIQNISDLYTLKFENSKYKWSIDCEVWEFKIYLIYTMCSLRSRNMYILCTVEFENSKYTWSIYCEVWDPVIYVWIIYCGIWDFTICMNYILWSLRSQNIYELYIFKFEISDYTLSSYLLPYTASWWLSSVAGAYSCLSSCKP